MFGFEEGEAAGKVFMSEHDSIVRGKHARGNRAEVPK
jgi:hypothetical protein